MAFSPTFRPLAALMVVLAAASAPQALVSEAMAAGPGGAPVPDSSVATVAAVDQAAAAMLPHRAEYALTLDTTVRGGQVVGAEGRQVYEVRHECDGWAMTNVTNLTLGDVEGGSKRYRWTHVAFENETGTRLRFRAQTAEDDHVVERVHGTARLGAKGGTAHYQAPEEKTVSLPKGTLFPLRFTAWLVAAARGDSPVVANPFFDGADATGLYHVTTVFSAKSRPPLPEALMKAADPAVRKALEGQGWHLDTAFHEPEGTAAPVFEVSGWLLANGIVRHVRPDYGDFALRSTLTKLTVLPEPDC